MTEQQKEDLGHLVLATIKFQSAIHSLDEITGEGNEFTRKKKKDWNISINYVHSFLKREDIDLVLMANTFVDAPMTQNYAECVEAFDSLGREINVKMQ